MQNVAQFEQLVREYRAIFFDAFGVLNDDKGMIAGVDHVLSDLKRQRFPFLIVTNDSSNLLSTIAQKFQQHNQLVVDESDILSSGALAQEYLTKNFRGARVAYFGEERSTPYLGACAEDAVHISQVDPSDRYDVFVMLGTRIGDWRLHLHTAINLIYRNPEIELIAPNPDLVFFAGKDRLGIASGSLAGLIERALHCQFRYFGKPHRIMYESAYERICSQHGTVSKDQILMIGDNLVTDIKGANDFGIQSALILTGITKPDEVELEMKKTGIRPTHILDSMVHARP